jgi:hypothetical protein
VIGTSGAEAGAGAGAAATAGAAGADGASGGADASVGAGASPGAVATGGCACEAPVSDAGVEGGAPGTPPVTLIESSPESSMLAGSGADAIGGAEFAGSLRIESPTVAAPVAPPAS